MKGGNAIISVLDRAMDAIPAARTPIRKLIDRVENFHYRSLDDRRYFDAHILPAIIARAPDDILYVGCRAYTADVIRDLTATGARVWTSDIDADAAAYGNAGYHVTLDITQIRPDSFPVARFDALILNGIIGHGVNSAEAIGKLAEALHTVAAPRALVVLGWNAGRNPDPLTIDEMAARFEPETIDGLPMRVHVPGTSHIYDFLVSRNAAGD